MIVHDPEFAGVGRFRPIAIQLLATCFVLLAAFAGLAGLIGVVQMFQGSRLARGQAASFGATLATLLVPVVVLVAGTWFLFRIGRGLRRYDPRARWAAVALLAIACVPPLTLAFAAARGGSSGGVVLSMVVLIPTAWAALMLSSARTDSLFAANGPAAIDLEIGPASEAVRAGPLLKLALAAFVVLLMIVLISMTRRP